jgi:hypothetical protein
LDKAAGLNSTHALINMIVFVICSLVLLLRVSCTWSNRKRGSRKGQVSGMKSVNMKIGEAAAAAMQAIGVAHDAGSERILNMVIPVATALAPDRGIDAVAQLRAAVAETPRS